MHITQEDARFWAWHRGPKWIVRKGEPPSIHACINGHEAHAPRNNKHHASNLCAFLRNNRRLHTFGHNEREALYYFAHITPHPPIERQHYARRWWRRLTKPISKRGIR